MANDMKMSNEIEIEVAFAGETKQAIIALRVKTGCTVREAIIISDILNQFAELRPFTQSLDALAGQLGIFGKSVALDISLKAGDRVEIYRVLPHDPKMARRSRAAKADKIARAKRLAKKHQSSSKRTT